MNRIKNELQFICYYFLGCSIFHSVSPKSAPYADWKNRPEGCKATGTGHGAITVSCTRNKNANRAHRKESAG